MFGTINNILITDYPKPPEACASSKVLYRVTFRYRTNLSGPNMYDVTDKNFEFDIYSSKSRIKAGSIVKYIPLNKKDANYNQPARVLRVSRVMRRDESGFSSSGKNSYDIKFLNPMMVNNRVVTEKKDVKVERLTLIPQLEGFICEKPFVDSNLITNYIRARNAYKRNKNPKSQRALKNAENALWNSNFVLDDNNQPKRPKWADQGQPGYDGQQALKQTLDKIITNMVNISFTPNKAKPKILGKKPKQSLEFYMPIGSKPGDIITVAVGDKNIIVKIPLKIQNNTIPKRWDKITAPITKIEKDPLDKYSVKDSPLVFRPTFIKSLESNDYHGDDYKLVKPSKNQVFKILNADIIKQNGHNFKFKELDNFDKNISQLVFDLEVDINLNLSKKTVTSEEERKQSPWKTAGRNAIEGWFNRSAVLNCPKKKEGLKRELGIVKRKLTPRPTLREIVKKQRFRGMAARWAGRGRAAAQRTRIAKNRASGRSGVRGGSRKKTRKTRRRRKRRTKRKTRRRHRRKTRKRR